jgi:hypothetical protein
MPAVSSKTFSQNGLTLFMATEMEAHMSFDSTFPVQPSHPDRALIQNRLTVAAMALVGLIFSGSFALSLSQATETFQSSFLHIEVTVTLGVTFTLLSIFAYLAAQQADSAMPWVPGSLSLFAAGQLLLYLALSQAFSAALNEVIYGIARVHRNFASLLGIGATVVWLTLLVLAPVGFLLKLRHVSKPWQRTFGWSVYGIGLLTVLAVNGEAYRISDGEEGTPRTRALNIMEQFVQPLTWSDPWDAEVRLGPAPAILDASSPSDSTRQRPVSLSPSQAGSSEETAAAAAIAAAIIALFALGVSFWQLDLSRRHNKLSVTPHLRFDVTIQDNNVQKIRLCNTGIGPAKITAYKIKGGTDTFSFEDWQCLNKALSSAGLEPERYGGYVPDKGEFIAVGEQKELFRVRDVTTEAYKASSVQEKIKQLVFEVQYRSVYGVQETAIGPPW